MYAQWAIEWCSHCRRVGSCTHRQVLHRTLANSFFRLRTTGNVAQLIWTEPWTIYWIYNLTSTIILYTKHSFSLSFRTGKDINFTLYQPYGFSNLAAKQYSYGTNICCDQFLLLRRKRSFRLAWKYCTVAIFFHRNDDLVHFVVHFYKIDNWLLLRSLCHSNCAFHLSSLDWPRAQVILEVLIRFLSRSLLQRLFH